MVALLRGINVGGRGVVGMGDLALAFTEAGAGNVTTVIQSGNVIFDASTAELPQVQAAAAAAVARLVGAEATIAFRSLHALERLVATDPFAPAGCTEHDKRYVAFLATHPQRRPALPLVDARQALEAIARVADDVFVVSRPLRGRYGFPNDFVEAAFGAPATTRNWNTVVRIVSAG